MKQRGIAAPTSAGRDEAQGREPFGRQRWRSRRWTTPRTRERQRRASRTAREPDPAPTLAVAANVAVTRPAGARARVGPSAIRAFQPPFTGFTVRLATNVREPRRVRYASR